VCREADVGDLGAFGQSEKSCGLRCDTSSVAAMKVQIDPWFIANPRTKPRAPINPKIAHVSKSAPMPSDNSFTAPILHTISEEDRGGTMARISSLLNGDAPKRALALKAGIQSSLALRFA